MTIDLGLSYAYSEQTLFPVIRVEQSAVGATGTVRYGLLNDVQVTVRLPAVWRRAATFSDATISEPAVAMRLGGEGPDVTISLNVPYSF